MCCNGEGERAAVILMGGEEGERGERRGGDGYILLLFVGLTSSEFIKAKSLETSL